jgi:glutathione S-transferase
MSATLFGVPASHPSLAAELMLRHKRVAFRRIDLVFVLHRAMVRGLGFSRSTVPALRIGGARVQGTRDISAALDRLEPRRPLFPADPERRRAVAEAEAWGDTELQPVARRLIWAGLKRDRSTVASYLEGAHSPVPVAVAERTAAPIILAAARLNKAEDPNLRSDLAELPRLLDRADSLLNQGTIGARSSMRPTSRSPRAPLSWPAWTTFGRSWKGGPCWSTQPARRPGGRAACHGSFPPPGCPPEQDRAHSVRSGPYGATRYPWKLQLHSGRPMSER